MKLKQRILFLMFIALVLLIFLAYYFVSYNKQIESLSSLSGLKTKIKELEDQLVKLNQQKSQLQTEIDNLTENINFLKMTLNAIQINDMNKYLVEKQMGMKEIDSNIDKITKNLEILKSIISQPFDIKINDITNYPEGFEKTKKNEFLVNSMMTGMPDVLSQPTKIDTINTQTIDIANDSKTNSILVITPVENNSFPVLFTVNISYKGDTNIWELSTADKNRDFMPNYRYNNEIIEVDNFSSKFLHDNTTYEIINKKIKIANIDLGNKIMYITTAGEVFDKNYNTNAKVEMDYRGMKIEFLNSKDTISGIIILLSPKIVNIQMPE